MEVPAPCVVEEQRDIEAYGQPLLSTQEHDTEEDMDGVFWKHQLSQQAADPLNIPQSFTRVKWIALIDRHLEVCLKLIKGRYMPDREEDERSTEDKGKHVAKGSESEHNWEETGRKISRREDDA